MNDIRIVSEKLEKLLTDRSVSVYEYTVSESETRELNTEKTDFNLFRTIFGGSVSVTVILDGRKGTASGNDLTDAFAEALLKPPRTKRPDLLSRAEAAGPVSVEKLSYT